MHARIRGYQIQPGRIEERLRHVREVTVPAIRQRPGYQGTLVLLDRAGHKNLTIGLWDSEDDVLTSQQDEAFRAVLSHPRFAEGEATTEVWEVVYEERIPPTPGRAGPTVARLMRFTVQPGRLDERLRFADEQTRPAARQVSGRLGVLLLANRATGETIAISLRRSAADLAAAAGNAAFEERRPYRHFAAGPVTQEQLEIAYYVRT